MPVIRSLTVRISSVSDDFTKGIQQARTEAQSFNNAVNTLARQQATVSSGFVTLTNRLEQSSVASKRLAAGMTSVASSALNTVPGVAQLGSVLGQFAIGAGPMVAILAGVAALSFAWRKLTEDARAAEAQLKKNAATAHEAAEAFRLGSLGLIQKDIFNASAAEAAAVTRAREAEAKLARLSGPGGMRSGALESERARIAAQAKAARDEAAKFAADIVHLTAKLEEEKKQIAEKGLRDRTQILDKEQRAFEKHADALIRAWQRMQLQVRDPFGRVRLHQAGELDLGYDPQLIRAQQGAARGMQAGAQAMGGGMYGGTGAPGSVDGDPRWKADLKKLGIDSKQLITNLATQGTTAFIGVTQKFVTDMLGLTKSAADVFREWSSSIDLMIRAMKASDEELQEMAASARVRAKAAEIGVTLPDIPLEQMKKSLEKILTLPPQSISGYEKYRKLLELVNAEIEQLNQTLEETAAAAHEAFIADMQRRQAAQFEHFIRAREETWAFGADLGERKARLGGDDMGAAMFRLTHQMEKQFEAAKKLYEAGYITEHMFLDMASVLAHELTDALAQAAAAIQEVAKAALEAAVAASNLGASWQIRLAEQAGDKLGAAILRLGREEEAAIQEALKAGADYGTIEKIREFFKNELARVRAEFAPAGAGFGGTTAAGATGSRIQDEVIRSVTGITETSAVRMVDLMRAQLGYLAYLPAIEVNTRGLNPNGIDEALGYLAWKKRQRDGDTRV